MGRLEQHLEALALLVASHEQHRGPRNGAGYGRSEAFEVHAVADDVVGTAERMCGSGLGLCRHRAPRRQAPGGGAGQGSQEAIGDARPSAVERAHLGQPARHQACVPGPGRQRLVQVQHVEAPPPHGSHGAPRGPRTEGDGGHRPVGGQSHRPAQPHHGPRCQARHCGVIVGGGEHHGVVPGPCQGRGQADDLPLDAARPAQAVGAQQRHPHRCAPSISGRSPPRGHWASSAGRDRARVLPAASRPNVGLNCLFAGHRRATSCTFSPPAEDRLRTGPRPPPRLRLSACHYRATYQPVSLGSGAS